MVPQQDDSYQSAQAALERLRFSFLSTVNHEMRTPVTLILQVANMLEGDYLGPLTDDQSAAIMSMRRQANTLWQMIDSLTRVAAFLSKQEEIRPVLARLDPVFNDVLSVAEFKARSKEIIILKDIDPALPPIWLDVKQISEALTQLVDNAIKFNRASGKVKVSAKADDNWVTIVVSDTGIGIASEQLKVVWDMFEQGIDPLQRAQEGLGLGLTLARYIIEAHQGTIAVETAPGQGSSFTVKLPHSPNSPNQ